MALAPRGTTIRHGGEMPQQRLTSAHSLLTHASQRQQLQDHYRKTLALPGLSWRTGPSHAGEDQPSCRSRMGRSCTDQFLEEIRKSEESVDFAQSHSTY